MEIISWVVFGALVGWVASLIMNTNEQQGGIANIIIGIIGALIGGLLARALGSDGVTGFNITSFLVSLAGAIILLAIIRMFSVPGRK